jgi:CCR4-NOT transcription complex subunit 9
MNDDYRDFEDNINTSTTQTSHEDICLIINWVNDLKNETTRETALVELSKKRDTFSDMALYIWYSPGIVTCL